MIGNGMPTEDLTFLKARLILPKQGVKVNLPSNSQIAQFNSQENKNLLQFCGENNEKANGFFVFSKWNAEIEKEEVLAISKTFSGHLVNGKDSSYEYPKGSGTYKKQFTTILKDVKSKELYNLQLYPNRVTNSFFERLLNLDIKMQNDDGQVIPRYVKITAYHAQNSETGKSYGVGLSLKEYPAKMDVDPLRDEATSVKPKFDFKTGEAEDGSSISRIKFEEYQGKFTIDKKSLWIYEDELFEKLKEMANFLDNNVKYTDFGTVAKSAPVLETVSTATEPFIEAQDDVFVPDDEDEDFNPDESIDEILDDDDIFEDED